MKRKEVFDQQENENFYNHNTKHLKTQSLRVRSQGLAFPLKKYHNAMKTQLLELALQQMGCPEVSVLDLACGRAGDFHKYLQQEAITRIVGLDSSSEAIKEATKRCQSMLSSMGGDHHIRRKKKPQLALQQVSSLQTNIWVANKPASFHLVHCMFALQYFCSTKEHLTTLLTTVYQNLVPGGLFVACVPDASSLWSLCLQEKNYHFQNTAVSFTIDQSIDPTEPEFGQPYTFTLEDTIIAETVQGVQNKEYLVWEELVLSVAKEVGLQSYPTTSLFPTAQEKERGGGVGGGGGGGGTTKNPFGLLWDHTTLPNRRLFQPFRPPLAKDGSSFHPTNPLSKISSQPLVGLTKDWAQASQLFSWFILQKPLHHPTILDPLVSPQIEAPVNEFWPVDEQGRSYVPLTYHRQVFPTSHPFEVQCLCGARNSPLWLPYQEQRRAGVPPHIILNRFGILQPCCRNAFLSHIDIPRCF